MVPGGVTTDPQCGSAGVPYSRNNDKKTTLKRVNASPTTLQKQVFKTQTKTTEIHIYVPGT